MTKKILASFGAAFMAVSIAACGGGSKPAETTPAPEAAPTADAGAMAPEGTSTGNPCSTGTGTPTTGNPCSTPK